MMLTWTELGVFVCLGYGCFEVVLQHMFVGSEVYVFLQWYVVGSVFLVSDVVSGLEAAVDLCSQLRYGELVGVCWVSLLLSVSLVECALLCNWSHLVALSCSWSYSCCGNFCVLMSLIGTNSAMLEPYSLAIILMCLGASISHCILSSSMINYYVVYSLLWRLIAVSYVIGCSRMEQACIFGLSMKQELNCIDFVPTVNPSVLCCKQEPNIAK